MLYHIYNSLFLFWFINAATEKGMCVLEGDGIPQWTDTGTGSPEPTFDQLQNQDHTTDA